MNKEKHDIEELNSGHQKIYKSPLIALTISSIVIGLSHPTRNLSTTMPDRTLRSRSSNTSYYIPPSVALSTSLLLKKPASKVVKSRIINAHSRHKIPSSTRNSLSNLQSTLPNLPYFSPLIHPRPLHTAQNHLPPNILAQNTVGPCQIFNLFFDHRVLEHMTYNTNMYAAEKRRKSPEDQLKQLTGRSWIPISICELKCWFGIIIYMGIVKMPAVSDYWRGEHDILWPRHDFSDYMSQTRFEEIKRYFHVAEIDTPKVSESGRRLWHGKIDPPLNQLRYASQTYRTPESNVTIDEAMIRFLGRSIDICKMPGKPIEIGYKFHCLADHGYVWNFWPHSGTKDGYDPLPSNAVQPSGGGLTPTGAMCLHLAMQLPYRTMSFNLYTDNYYTTLDLLANLRSIGIGGCGTTRRDRTGYPEILKVPPNAATKVEYHFMTGAVNHEVATLLWFDNSPVLLMTTIHPLKGRRSQVLTKRRKPTRSNPLAARHVFKDATSLTLPILACINDYNQNKVGVDVADQYQSYYSTQLITHRNWYPMFFWILDTALINSFIIYRDLNQYQGLQHKDFRMHVAWDLILGGKQIQHPKLQPECVTNKAQPVSISSNPSLHLPSSVSVQDRRVCIRCQEKKKVDSGLWDKRYLPKTQWKCNACNLPLCLTASRNCFYEYHQAL